jgi:hypothetical protein
MILFFREGVNLSKYFSKRGNYISLSSFDLDHVFFGLLNGDSDNKIISNFLFEMSFNKSLQKFDDETILNLNIFIPMHQKYLRFSNSFTNFNSLLEYMSSNKKDNLIIPFLGDDLS